MHWNRPVTAACNFNARRCMCLKKARYDTKQLAAATMQERLVSDTQTPEFLRAYRCPVCRGWHLTSKKL